MGERLSYVIDVPQELRRAALPTMMLLTLVENAIKHGLNPVAGRRHDRHQRAGTRGRRSSCASRTRDADSLRPRAGARASPTSRPASRRCTEDAASLELADNASAAASSPRCAGRRPWRPHEQDRNAAEEASLRRPSRDRRGSRGGPMSVSYAMLDDAGAEGRRRNFLQAVVHRFDRRVAVLIAVLMLLVAQAAFRLAHLESLWGVLRRAHYLSRRQDGSTSC